MPPAKCKVEEPHWGEGFIFPLKDLFVRVIAKSLLYVKVTLQSCPRLACPQVSKIFQLPVWKNLISGSSSRLRANGWFPR